jgi:uncharacterized membrane protein
MIGRLARSLPAVVLGAVFVVAAVLKGIDPLEFARQVGTYGIVGGRAAAVAAYLFVPAELALGAALVVGWRRRMAALGIIAMLVLFMAATAYAWSQGKTEGCGCFGSFVSRTPGEVLVEDAALLLLGLLAYRLAPREREKAAGRRAVVAVILIAGALLPFVAYAMPIDPWVTLLRVGRPVADLPLRESPIDLVRGDHLVALLDLNGPGNGPLVKQLNGLAGAPGGPGVIAFYGGEVDEKVVFCFNYDPGFELVAVPALDLKRLYRRLPRFFRVRDGRVIRIWEFSPPAREELS